MRTFWLTSLMVFLAIGCSNTLETGYKPKSLGVTDDARKGYYAPPFSPEAEAAQQGGIQGDAPKSSAMRRPDGY